MSVRVDSSNVCTQLEGHRKGETLILQVPNIDAGHKSARGRTALHLAVASGSKEIVQLLLEKGVNPNVMSPESLLP